MKRANHGRLSFPDRPCVPTKTARFGPCHSDVSLADSTAIWLLIAVSWAGGFLIGLAVGLS